MRAEPAAIVTGGGGGIGRAASLALASGGARVLVVDLDGARAEETAAAVVEAGGTASATVADVTDPEAVAAYVGECERRYGGVDAFFNNAGYEGAIAEIAELPAGRVRADDGRQRPRRLPRPPAGDPGDAAAGRRLDRERLFPGRAARCPEPLRSTRRASTQ